MDKKEHQDKTRSFKEKIMRIVYQKQLYSVMNNTKWRELQNVVKSLSYFSIPYEEDNGTYIIYGYKSCITKRILLSE